jgi:hypothetical protein
MTGTNPLYKIVAPPSQTRHYLAALAEHLAITGLNPDMARDMLDAARYHGLPDDLIKMLEATPDMDQPCGAAFIEYLKLFAEQLKGYHMDRFTRERLRVRRDLAPWHRLEELLAIAQTELLRAAARAALYGAQAFMTRAVNRDWVEEGDLPYGANIYHNVGVEIIFNYENEEYEIDLLPDGADPDFTEYPRATNLFYELWGESEDQEQLRQNRSNLLISDETRERILSVLRWELKARPSAWRQRVIEGAYDVVRRYVVNAGIGMYIYRRGDVLVVYDQALQERINTLADDEVLVVDYTDIDYEGGDIGYSAGKFVLKLASVNAMGMANGLEALYRHVGLPEIADFLSEHPVISLIGLLELTLYGSQGVTEDVQST